MEKNQDRILQMLALQNNLNTNTNGAEWVKGVTKDNREINWFRCIYMEGSEFIDSFNWKHWKDINIPPNLQNARMELVDMWHFVLSQAIVSSMSSTAVYNMLNVDVDVDLSKNRDEQIIDSGEQIIRLSLSAILPTGENHLSPDLFKNIKKIMILLDMSIEDLYNLYMVKNWLNEFRQHNGYKEGSYIKNLTVDNNTLEDNDLLLKLIEDYGSLEVGFMQFKEFYKNYKITQESRE